MALCVYTTISFVYIISHIRLYLLNLPYGLLNSFYLPYDVTPYGYNALYFNLYGLICPCTTYTVFYVPIWLNVISYSILQYFFT